jgi:hypothetical protein
MKEVSRLLGALGWAMLWLGGGCFPATAQEVQTSTAGLGFWDPLNPVDAPARAAALGSAFTAVAGDSSDILFNPAGLAFLDSAEVSLNNRLGWSGLSEETALLGLPLVPGGALALAGSYLSFGSFEGRDDGGRLTSGYGADQVTLHLGGGLALPGGLAFGFALHALQENLDGVSYLSGAPDAGFFWAPLPGWGLGLDYMAEGWGSWNGSRNATWRTGASWKAGGVGFFQLLVCADYFRQSDSFQTARFGAEAGFGRAFFIRTGYEAPLQDNGNGGIGGLSLGAGCDLAGFQLDYAYQPGGVLGDTQLFSLGCALGSVPTATPIPAPSPTATPTPPGIPPKPSLIPQPAADKPVTGALTVRFDIPPDFVAQAETLESQGRLQEAVNLYQQAAQEDPKNALIWNHLGKVFYGLKQKDQAVSCFEKVLELDPQDLALRDWLDKYKAEIP